MLENIVPEVGLWELVDYVNRVTIVTAFQKFHAQAVHLARLLVFTVAVVKDSVLLDIFVRFKAFNQP